MAVGAAHQELQLGAETAEQLGTVASRLLYSPRHVSMLASIIHGLFCSQVQVWVIHLFKLLRHFTLALFEQQGTLTL